jgi:FtsH-binding integral membrane protein
MGIGLGIFLIVAGAILTFALNLTVAGLNLDVIGWILMLAGLANLIFFIYVTNRRRSSLTGVQRPPYDDPNQPPL